MQKKMITLAVAGLVSGATSAQGSINLYGVVDLGQAWFKGDGKGNNPDQKTVGRLDSNSSLLGFKGVEDLGNGLKAFFLYESHIDASTNGGLVGGRDSYVGLSGPFGTVMAGNLTPPLRGMAARIEFTPGAAGFGTTIAVTGKIAALDLNTGVDDRANNTVAYISPNFGGFNATLAYVNGEFRQENQKGIAGNDPNVRAWQLAAQYDRNGLFVGVGYHRAYDGVAPNGNGMKGGIIGEGIDTRIWRIVAQYAAPFGTTFAALYDNTRIDNAAYLLGGSASGAIQRAAWSLGAKQAFGNNTIGLEYGHSGETEVSGGDNANDSASIWTAVYAYAFSKRTMVHARYSRLTNDDGGRANFYLNPVNNGAGALGNGVTYTGFMVSLRHTF